MDYTKYYLEEFKKFIALRSSSTNTIKNYLSDLRVFFNFVTDQLGISVSFDTLPSLLSEASLVKYDEFLSATNPPATAKRRTSSLKKFIEFCATQNFITTPVVPPPNIVNPPPFTPPTPYVAPLSWTPAPVPEPTSITNSSVETGPTPWSAILSPKPQPQPEPQPQPTPSPVNFSPEPSPSLVNFLPDLNQPETKPDYLAPVSSGTLSLYLVLTFVLIAFLASFSLTYFIATAFLSK